MAGTSPAMTMNIRRFSFRCLRDRSPDERSDIRGIMRYRRNRIEGGRFFFTLTLADRRSTALVDHVATLRGRFV